MAKYVVQRVLLMLITLLIITCICFVLIRMLPPAELPLNDIHTQVIEARREAQGYNEPYMVQFGIFLKNIFTKWDWGISDKLYFGQDVASIFAEKLPENPMKGEYYLPFAVDELIQAGRATAQVLTTTARWFGVTYQEDKPVVSAAIAQMTAQGEYPAGL